MKSTDQRLIALLQEARRQLENERARRTEPIAIVGIGCRFPGGATSTREFWNLLAKGTDTTSAVPPDRWDSSASYDPDPSAPGKSYVQRGAFLDRIDGFDPQVFGISPREAEGLDPQQRLLLECAWEALEEAGVPVESASGTATGVWVGLCVDDYARRSITSGDLERIDAYTALGNLRSVAAGRIAYVLGLHGPALQVDTACSSSLVALHLACQSLRLGECERALVGGANIMCAPETTVALCKLRALAPDGRCKTFDASADGYGRGEGAGVVLLERLSDARAAGRHVIAVIRGTAVNHDGRSNGLTAPNGAAQQAVIRAALGNADVDPARVGYVEVHGTGTPLGDPIEVLSLSQVYAAARTSTHPLYLGSVKTNIGHLEGAAGIAGVIKAALCLERRQLVPHLHFQTPNPRIPWDRLPIEVATTLRPFPDIDGAHLAAVSSFGISGTNAHAILERAPAADLPATAPTRAAELVCLSAKSAQAVNAGAQRLRDQLRAHPELGLGDLAFSSATTRSLLSERLLIAAPSRAALDAALEAAARGETPGGAARGSASRIGKTAFLFTGQGAQVAGMGSELYGEWRVFRDAFDAALAVLDPLLETPLGDVLWGHATGPRGPLLNETAYTQPALFAFEWALASTWQSFGVLPDVVAGHSIGEIAAATLAGVFDLESAARLVCARARLMQALPARGAMVSIEASEQSVRDALERSPGQVSLAAVNASTSCVIAGEEPEVMAIALGFAERGVQTRRLNVSHAFHSPLMEPMLGEFRRVVERLRLHAPTIPIISNRTGKLAGAELVTPEYWVQHVRDAVLFAAGVRELHTLGVRAYIEVGPRPILSALVPRELGPENVPVLVPSLRSGRSEPQALLEALGTWLAQGGSVDWSGVFPSGGRRVALPTYAWQRESYWLDAPQAALPRRAHAARHTSEARAREAAASAALYQLEWRAAPTRAQSQGPSGPWIIVAPHDASAAEALAAALREAGASAAAQTDVTALSATSADHVVCVWERGGDADSAMRAASEGLAVVQALAALPEPPRLWWLTRGAVAARQGDVVSVAGSTVWGLGRTVHREHPELRCTLLDTDGSQPLVTVLMRECATADGENEVAWRGAERLAARLTRASGSSGVARGEVASKPGSVLITGGLGALGLEVARALLLRGYRRLVLVSRRGAGAPGADAALRALRDDGAQVIVESADVSDGAALARVVSSIPAGHPLRGIVHAAGLLDDGTLATQTPERLRAVMAPKVLGAWHLHHLSANVPLDFFVLFSSLAGTLGSSGQGGYAAANTFLDALAAHRHALGLPAVSLAWGPWASAGLAASQSELHRARLERSGLSFIPIERALALFDEALGRSEAHLIPAAIDLEQLATQTAGRAPIWRALLEANTAAARPEATPDLRGLPPGERRTALLELLRTEAARVLALGDASRVPTERRLDELGLDSLMALELRNSIGRRLNVTLPAALLAEEPTIAGVARNIEALLASVPSPPAGPHGVARGQCIQQLAVARARLVCFPDAGGSPSLFEPFAVMMGAAGIEVHVVAPSRARPPDASAAEAYLRDALDYIGGLASAPIALFGHSLGGVFAWRVAHALASTSAPRPLLLAVSAIAASRMDQPAEAESEFDAQFRVVVGDRADAARTVRADFVHDMQLWSAMPRPRLAPLDIPIVAFAGDEDHVAPAPEVRPWAHATRAAFELANVAGGHFYLGEPAARERMLAALRTAIERAARERSAPP